MVHLLKLLLPLALIGLIGCEEKNHKECYLALHAVAESTEKYNLLGGENSLNSIWWKAAMYEAVNWKAQACKKSE